MTTRVLYVSLRSQSFPSLATLIPGGQAQEYPSSLTALSRHRYLHPPLLLAQGLGTCGCLRGWRTFTSIGKNRSLTSYVRERERERGREGERERKRENSCYLYMYVHCSFLFNQSGSFVQLYKKIHPCSLPQLNFCLTNPNTLNFYLYW